MVHQSAGAASPAASSLLGASSLQKLQKSSHCLKIPVSNSLFQQGEAQLKRVLKKGELYPQLDAGNAVIFSSPLRTGGRD